MSPLYALGVAVYFHYRWRLELEFAPHTFAVQVRGPALVALVPTASDPLREGFVRVINLKGANSYATRMAP